MAYSADDYVNRYYERNPNIKPSKVDQKTLDWLNEELQKKYKEEQMQKYADNGFAAGVASGMASVYSGYTGFLNALMGEHDTNQKPIGIFGLQDPADIMTAKQEMKPAQEGFAKLEEEYAPARNWSSEDIFNDPMGYITDPSGLRYNLGSQAGFMLGTAPLGGLGGVATKLALNTVGRAGTGTILGNTLAGRGINAIGRAANTKTGTGAILGAGQGGAEAMVEGGLVYRDLIAQGKSPEEASAIALEVAAKNIPTSVASGAAMGGVWGRTANRFANPTTGSRVLNTGKALVFGAPMAATPDALQEVVQEGITGQAKGEKVFDIYSPETWSNPLSPEQKSAALQGFIGSAIFGGVPSAVGAGIRRPQPRAAEKEKPVVKANTTSGNKDIDRIIEEKSKQYGIDPNLVHAVIWQESRYNPKAVSPKGAVGLMQLMEGTAGDLGVTNREDIEQNIDGGIRYLKQMYKKNGGDWNAQDSETWEKALASYNGGYGNRNATQTRLYAHDVWKKYNEFKGENAEADTQTDVKAEDMPYVDEKEVKSNAIGFAKYKLDQDGEDYSFLNSAIHRNDTQAIIDKYSPEEIQEWADTQTVNDVKLNERYEENRDVNIKKILEQGSIKIKDRQMLPFYRQNEPFRGGSIKKEDGGYVYTPPKDFLSRAYVAQIAEANGITEMPQTPNQAQQTAQDELMGQKTDSFEELLAKARQRREQEELGEYEKEYARQDLATVLQRKLEQDQAREESARKEAEAKEAKEREEHQWLVNEIIKDINNRVKEQQAKKADDVQAGIEIGRERMKRNWAREKERRRDAEAQAREAQQARDKEYEELLAIGDRVELHNKITDRMARRSAAKDRLDKYVAKKKELTEEEALFDDFIEHYYPNNEKDEVVDAFLDRLRQERNERIVELAERLRGEAAKGVDIIVSDDSDGRGIRQSNNEEWYKKLLNDYGVDTWSKIKKGDREYSLLRIARDMLLNGDEQYEGDPTYIELEDTINGIEAYKNKLERSADNGRGTRSEVDIREEEYQEAKSFGSIIEGNRETARNGFESWAEGYVDDKLTADKKAAAQRAAETRRINKEAQQRKEEENAKNQVASQTQVGQDDSTENQDEHTEPQPNEQTEGTDGAEEVKETELAVSETENTTEERAAPEQPEDTAKGSEVTEEKAVVLDAVSEDEGFLKRLSKNERALVADLKEKFGEDWLSGMREVQEAYTKERNDLIEKYALQMLDRVMTYKKGDWVIPWRKKRTEWKKEGMSQSEIEKKLLKGMRLEAAYRLRKRPIDSVLGAPFIGEESCRKFAELEAVLDGYANIQTQANKYNELQSKGKTSVDIAKADIQGETEDAKTQQRTSGRSEEKSGGDNPSGRTGRKKPEPQAKYTFVIDAEGKNITDLRDALPKQGMVGGSLYQDSVKNIIEVKYYDSLQKPDYERITKLGFKPKDEKSAFDEAAAQQFPLIDTHNERLEDFYKTVREWCKKQGTGTLENILGEVGRKSFGLDGNHSPTGFLKFCKQAVLKGYKLPQQWVDLYKDTRKGNEESYEAFEDIGKTTSQEAEEKKTKEAGQDAASKPQKQPKAKIEDFGDKIGGARKDMSYRIEREKTEKKPKNEKSDIPAWRKPFEIVQQENGKWQVKYDRGNRKTVYQYKNLAKKEFDSREEAENQMKFTAYSVMFGDSYRENESGAKEYYIYKRINDRKRYTLPMRFERRDDLLQYVEKHIDDLLETKTSYGEGDLLTPEIAEWQDARRGNAKDRLQGRDATAQMFQADFGFKGVQFGNWNNQDERQELMNAAYEALHDLADVLGLPPKIISLNGNLSLAFGARGHGLSGARAHYEPAYTIINLTKMKGAGSLAHEWLHALDHYLMFKAGVISNNRDDLGRLEGSASNWYKYASDEKSWVLKRANLNPKLKEAFSELVQSLFYKKVVEKQDVNDAQNWVAKASKRIDDYLTKLRNYIAKEREFGSRKKPATEEQLRRFDELSKEFVKAEEEPVWDSSKQRFTTPTLDKIAVLVKEITGRGFAATDDRHKTLMYLRNLYHVKKRVLDDAQKNVEKSKNIPTEYSKNNTTIDTGRTTDYWTKPTEMLARAFSSMIEDNLHQKGQTSDFLSYGSDNRLLFFGKPFPEGDERKAINENFKAFFKEVAKEVEKTKADTGEIKFSVISEVDRTDKDSTADGERSYGEILEEVKKAFPNAKNMKYEGNDIVVSLPNGAKVRVSIKDKIIVNEKAAERARKAHGVEDDDDILIQGYWQKVSGSDIDGILAVSKESEDGATYHESLHMAMDLALTPKEKKALTDFYTKEAQEKGMDVEEAIANGYAKWRKNRENAKFKGVFKKLHDFWHRLKAVFTGIENAHNVMRRIESGEVWERNRDALMDEDEGTKLSIRKKPAPQKTIKSYKLFQVLSDGTPTALFIDSGKPIKRGVWHDADSPLIKDMENLPVGKTYVVDNNGNVTERNYGVKETLRKKGVPKLEPRGIPKKDVQNLPLGQRLIFVGQYANGEKSYHNVGINGSGSVALFAMRPGWHSTDVPSARHIGAGKGVGAEAKYRRANERWFEIEISADVDYHKEASQNPDGDIPAHIPTDGWYSFKTNTNASDDQNWIISGAIKINRPLSEAEARQIAEERGVTPDLPYKDGKKDFSEYDLEESPIRYSVRQTKKEKANSSWIKHKFGKTKNPTHERRVKDAITNLTGLKVAWGHTDKDIVYDKKQGVIRTRTAQDWGRVVPQVAEILAERLGMGIKTVNGKKTVDPAMRDYITDYIFTGALTKAKTKEAKEFERIMQRNPKESEDMLSLRCEFERYSELTLSEQAMENLETDVKQSRTLKQKAVWTIMKTVDKYYPIRQASMALYEKFKEAGEELPKYLNPYTIVKNVSGATAQASMLIHLPQKRLSANATENKRLIQESIEATKDMIRREFPSVAEHLIAKFKPLELILQEAGMYGNDTEAKKFQTYMVARRMLELHGRENIEEFPEVYNTPEKCRQIIAELEKPAYVQAAKDMYNLQTLSLAIQVDCGVLSQAYFDRVTNENKNYIPLRRLIEDEKVTKNADSYKKVEGSARIVWAPFDQAMDNIAKGFVKAQKNKAVAQIGQATKLLGQAHTIEAVENNKPNSRNIVNYLVNGERVYIEAYPELAEALRHVTEPKSSLGMLKIVTLANRCSRELLTTNNPEFALSAFFRDAMNFFLYEAGDPIDLFKGLKHTLLRDSVFQEYMTSGAAQSVLTAADKDYFARNVTGSDKGSLDGFKNVVGRLDKISSFLTENLEQAVRVAAYEKTKNKVMKEELDNLEAKLRKGGMTEAQIRQAIQEYGMKDAVMTAMVEARLAARDLMDFASRGEWGDVLNSYSWFANAIIQGGYKSVRSFNPKDPANKGKVQGRLLRLAGVCILQAALSAWGEDDEEIKGLSDVERYMYFHFSVGDRVLRIPKGDDLAIRTLTFWIDMAFNKRKATLERAMLPIENAVPNFLLPSLVKPIVEVLANYSLFYNSEIVPKRLQNPALPEREHDAFTSRLAKEIGEAFHWSPKKIDYMMNSYFGGLGRAARGGIDWAVDGKAPKETVGVRRFVVPKGKTSVLVNDAYEYITEQDALYKDWQGRRKYDSGAKPDERLDKARYSRLKSDKKKLQELTKKIRENRENPRITEAQREANHLAFTKARNKLAESIVFR